MTCSLFAVRCTQPSAEDEANKRASIIKEQLEQAGNLIASGDAEQATHILETLNQNYPGETDILENLAFAYSNQNAYDEAAFYFDQVAALDKDTHLILYAAQAHENAGNTALAQERYMRYLEKNPEDTLAWKRSLQLALAAQNKQYALDAQLAIIKHENRAASAEEALALGDLFSALGNRAQALDWYQEAFKQAKSEEAAAKRLVQLYAETSNWETASDYLTQLEKKKSSELGSLKDSEALAGIQQWREEQAEIERKAREAEETARLAEEEAIRAAEIAELKANPPPPTAESLKEQADTAREIGNFEEAIGLYWKSLSLNDSSAAIWFTLSDCYWQLGRIQESEPALLEAMRREPKNLGYTLRYLKMVEQTRSKSDFITELEQAKENFPRSPQITLALARAYETVDNNPRNARFLYREFLNIAAPDHPGRPDAELALSRLHGSP